MTDAGPTAAPPPLGLYVHLPWCVRKCPYCDFNSHALRGDLPADAYVGALLTDLEAELPLVWGRVVHSVFLGGGTPSLFPADQVARLIEGIRSRVPLSPRAEITLEANPGTVEHGAFADYRAAGINRVSLGVQSFDDGLLERIGRIHSGAEAERAVASLHACGLENFNIDLMFGLPGQSGAQACDDIRRALDCRPAHLSHYRLTLEPNTAFHAKPPVLPDDDLAWSMQAACAQLLASAGFFQYEVSAWARPRRECRHNLNYWRYGDYLGIGAGAHGKVSLMAEQSIRRRIRHRHPEHWMQRAHAGGGLAVEQAVAAEDRVFEFFLNQLRLRAGASKTQFSARTLLPWDRAAAPVQRAIDQGLLEEDGDRLLHTELGWRFSNETQALFLP